MRPTGLKRCLHGSGNPVMHPRTARSHPTTGLCEISPNDAIIEPKKECRNAQDQDIVSRGHHPGRFRRISRGCSCNSKESLDAQTLDTIRSDFRKLLELANRHDFQALHEMFWQSPSTLLVAKNAIPSEGNWAGFWGNEAIDQKLYDIGTSGPVVLEPDYSKLKVVGLTQDIAESYVPMNITVSYAGQDGTPKPFLMIINWIKVGKAWKVASEIILPVPPAPAAKG